MQTKSIYESKSGIAWLADESKCEVSSVKETLDSGSVITGKTFNIFARFVIEIPHSSGKIKAQQDYVIICWADIENGKTVNIGHSRIYIPTNTGAKKHIELDLSLNLNKVRLPVSNALWTNDPLLTDNDKEIIVECFKEQDFGEILIMEFLCFETDFLLNAIRKHENTK